MIVLEDRQLIEATWEHGNEYSLCADVCEPFSEYKMLAATEHYMAEQCVVRYTGCLWMCCYIFDTEVGGT